MLEDDVFVKHQSTDAHSSTVSSSQTYYDVIASYTTSSFLSDLIYNVEIGNDSVDESSPVMQ